MDQLLQYYRISIRCRKWTLKAIMHFIDFAIVNSWIEYRRDCKRLKYAEKDIMDSMAFRAEVANTLNNVYIPPTPVETPRGRGRPLRCVLLDVDNTDTGRSPFGSSANPSSPSMTPEGYNIPMKKIRQMAPPKHVVKDNYEHLPEFQDIKSAQRCMNNGFSQKTFIFCTKCEVFLCAKRNQNCFKDFHSNNE